MPDDRHIKEPELEPSYISYHPPMGLIYGKGGSNLKGVGQK
jgi:hypothetical protein